MSTSGGVGGPGPQGPLLPDCSFNPAIAAKAVKAVTATIRSWNIHRKSDLSVSDLVRRLKPKIDGWVA